MLLSFHHNAGQDHVIKTACRLSANVSWFRYFGMAITNQNLIQEEIRKKLRVASRVVLSSIELVMY
jgi:hypothetical protein